MSLEEDRAIMQKFEYRHPRFSVDFPVKFIAQNSTLVGRCTEISKEGMRLEVLQPLLSNSCGKVSMRYQDRTLEINVRVAHVGAAHGGLEFLCESNVERNEVAHLVASLTAPQNRPALILLHRV